MSLHKEDQWKECLQKAEQIVASYRSEAPKDFDPVATWVAAGVAAAGIAVSVASSATGNFGANDRAAKAAGKGGAAGGAGGFPSYGGTFTPIPNMNDNPNYGTDSLNSQMGGLQKAAASETAFQTKQREKIMPGSANQFKLASNALQSELQGQVPQDVVDFTNRTVAQRLGGGFNPFTQGGQAPSNFARNIGQTSYGIQQQALQQAPQWQQLANSFVIGIPQVQQQAQSINQLKYQYDALNTGINQFNTEGQLGVVANQYQNQVDQYNAGQIAQQQQAQQYGNMANTAVGALNAGAKIYGAYQYNNPQNLAASGNGTPIAPYVNNGSYGQPGFQPALSQSTVNSILA